MVLSRESYNRVRAKTYLVVKRFMRGRKSFNEHDCQDLVSSIMFVVVTKEHTIREKRAFKSWLSRVTKNKIFDYLRSAESYSKKYPMIASDIVDENNEQYIEVSLGKEDTTETKMYLNDILILIKNKAEKKDKQFIEALFLYISGYNYKEISVIMEVAVGTARSRISRGRAVVREYLREEGINKLDKQLGLK